MVRNLLNAVAPQTPCNTSALVTGLKHYLGPFEAYGKGGSPANALPRRAGPPRRRKLLLRSGRRVFAAAARDGFTWSVHRPHTIIGYALGNAMNMGVTLAVYATICRETGRPFPSPAQPRSGTASPT
jgi:hypothetical protein